MGRLLVLLMGLLAAPLAATVVADFEHYTYLRSHETVRYRIDFEYGSGSDAVVEIITRGFDTAPRVTVLDSGRNVVKSRRDNGGDWTLDFSFTAIDEHNVYYIEVESAGHWIEGGFETNLLVRAEPDAEAVIYVDKYTTGRSRHHHHCSTGSGHGGLPLAGFAAAAAAIVWFRRRRLGA